MLNMLSNSTFNRVLRIVKEWQPKKNYASEAGYRDDLLAFIKKELKRESGWGFPPEKHRIRKESGRYFADIGIDKEIGIELKRNLNTRQRFYTLTGQIRGLLREYECVIAVLCGNTNEEIFDDLQVEAKELSTIKIWRQKIVEIVDKSK